jgi:magnesium transporter
MPVLTGLQIDLDEIEGQVFAAEPHAPKRTYQLTREVIEFHRAVSPLRNMLADLRNELKDPGGTRRVTVHQVWQLRPAWS